MTFPTLRWFKPTELNHPELCAEDALQFLDMVRNRFGAPITVTDDARLPSDHPSGSSPTSWHYKGRAFDLRAPTSPQLLWRLVAAIVLTLEDWKVLHGGHSIELELVSGPTDKHIHFALKNDASASELELALD